MTENTASGYTGNDKLVFFPKLKSLLKVYLLQIRFNFGFELSIPTFPS